MTHVFTTGRRLSRVLCLLLICLVALPACGTSAESAAQGFPAVVVNCSEFVSLRAAPSTRAQRMARVPLGAHVTLLSRAAYRDGDDTFMLSLYQGMTGYILIDYLDVIIDSANPLLQTRVPADAAGYVTASGRGDDLVMRAGPGTEYGILGILFGGEVATYTGETRAASNGRPWYHCLHLGQDCWISSRYSVLYPVSSAVAELPAATPTPAPAATPGMFAFITPEPTREATDGVRPGFYWQDMMETVGLIGDELHMTLPEGRGDAVIFELGEEGDSESLYVNWRVRVWTLGGGRIYVETFARWPGRGVSTYEVFEIGAGLTSVWRQEDGGVDAGEMARRIEAEIGGTASPAAVFEDTGTREAADHVAAMAEAPNGALILDMSLMPYSSHPDMTWAGHLDALLAAGLEKAQASGR